MAEEAKEKVETIEKTPAETTTALAILDTDKLSKESVELINALIAESDIEKTKDLTYLFNINQNKKTMVRMDKLSELQDKLVAQFSKRISERPDEISNQELMQALKIVQDILERGQKQIVGTTEQPLIQINQQTNSVNVGDEAVSLSRESKQRIANAVGDLLKDLGTTGKPIDIDAIPAETVEVKKDD